MNQGWCHDCSRQYMWADNNSSNCPDCSAALSELRAIVRAVAELDPLVGILSRNGDSLHCEICGAIALVGTTREAFQHPEDCPWVRARKALGMG